MEQIIITSGSARDLSRNISEMIKEGWEPVGSHQVVERNHILQYSGMQHKRTQIEIEYSQSMRKGFVC
jgi:hypothetical protein